MENFWDLKESFEAHFEAKKCMLVFEFEQGSLLFLLRHSLLYPRQSKCMWQIDLRS